MLLKTAQTFNEQASTGMFVPGIMATYCHGKPLLAAPKAQKASAIIKTSENERTQESIRDGDSDKQLADWIGLPSPTQWIRPFVGLSRGDKTLKSFVLS